MLISFRYSFRFVYETETKRHYSDSETEFEPCATVARVRIASNSRGTIRYE